MGTPKHPHGLALTYTHAHSHTHGRAHTGTHAHIHTGAQAYTQPHAHSMRHVFITKRATRAAADWLPGACVQITCESVKGGVEGTSSEFAHTIGAPGAKPTSCKQIVWIQQHTNRKPSIRSFVGSCGMEKIANRGKGRLGCKEGWIGNREAYHATVHVHELRSACASLAWLGFHCISRRYGGGWGNDSGSIGARWKGCRPGRWRGGQLGLSLFLVHVALLQWVGTATRPGGLRRPVQNA